MTLNFEQIRAYFQHRLPGQKIGTRNKVAVKCCFHDDKTPSMTLFLDGAGGAHCNGCGWGGNVFQFEAKFSASSIAAAESAVAEITGAKAERGFGSFAKLGPATATYDYRDDNGLTLYQKRRYQPEGETKTFRVFRPDERGGWVSGIDGDRTPTKRVLYNQPQVVTANFVSICEGEKDADNVAQLELYRSIGYRTAATCNFDGAWKPGERAKWLASYNPYFAGKFVCIFEDNDENGRAWSEHVAAQIYPFAVRVKIVRLPGLAEHGDVSDWLEGKQAQASDVEEEIKRAPYWKPREIQREYAMFQDAIEFAAEAPLAVDWLVDGVIPRASNGIIGGEPKASKSYHALDLAMALSAGAEWLGIRIPRAIRTAVVSREDSPGMTQRRIKMLALGRSAYASIEGRMLVNTRRHQADFAVTTPEHLDALIEQLQRFRAELIVLDVFRSIHGAEENDNTEVAQVLAKCARIQTECDCAVALVHHISKAEHVNIFKGLRGASCIHGWMEWGVGISVTNPEAEDRKDYVRRLEFECKEGTRLPVYTQIREFATGTVRLEIVQRATKSEQKRAATSGNRQMPLERERRDLD